MAFLREWRGLIETFILREGSVFNGQGVIAKTSILWCENEGFVHITAVISHRLALLKTKIKWLSVWREKSRDGIVILFGTRSLSI